MAEIIDGNSKETKDTKEKSEELKQYEKVIRKAEETKNK